MNAICATRSLTEEVSIETQSKRVCFGNSTRRKMKASDSTLIAAIRLELGPSHSNYSNADIVTYIQKLLVEGRIPDCSLLGDTNLIAPDLLEGSEPFKQLLCEVALELIRRDQSLSSAYRRERIFELENKTDQIANPVRFIGW